MSETNSVAGETPIAEQRVAGLIQLLPLAIEIGKALYQGVAIARDGAALIERLVAENREPTEAEWAQLRAIREPLLAEIRAAAAAGVVTLG